MAAGGISPTAMVEKPMMSKVATSVRLRPIRSPKWPKMAAPTGREKKATPKVANDNSAAMTGVCSGKNTLGNTSAAAVP